MAQRGEWRAATTLALVYVGGGARGCDWRWEGCASQRERVDVYGSHGERLGEGRDPSVAST